jgi:hypothetical protein
MKKRDYWEDNRHRWENAIKIDLMERMGLWDGINLAQYTDKWRAVVNMVTYFTFGLFKILGPDG